MDKSKLSLASVKLINGGMKGIEVEYALPSVKGNVKFLDTYKSKRKAPIHTELEECFGWLKGHLLDICGFSRDNDEREYQIKLVEVTGVKYGEKGFVIIGKLSVLAGQKEIDLETPLIADEIEYEEFSDVVNIIQGIYTETAEYLAGKKVMSDVQIVARFNAKNEEFDLASFNKMTKAEQRDIATKILEEQGCMVFHNDELTEDDDAAPIDTTQEIEIKTEVVSEETTEEDDFTAPIQAASQEKTKTVVLEEGEDFTLPLVITPPKKSTAKKKAA